jgi:N-methylhydantoinase A
MGGSRGRSRRKGSQMGWRVGVDIGGTFTDVALIEEETSRIAVVKVPTTLEDFAKRGDRRKGAGRDSIEPLRYRFSHATTVVTTALLEKPGPDL